MTHRLLLFGLAGLLAVTAATLAWGIGSRDVPAGEALRRALFLGPPLVVIELPKPGVFPVGSVPVLVRFPDEDRVAPETFRCLLNGLDVTAQLTRGSNGAGGAVWPLRPGRNTLRFEVFGAAFVGPWVFEDAAEVEIRVTPPRNLDRA